MISPRHEEARKVAAVARRELKAEGAIGAEDHAVTVLRRMDLGPKMPGSSYITRPTGNSIRAGPREEAEPRRNTSPSTAITFDPQRHSK